MIRTKLHVLASNIDPVTHQVGKDNKIIQEMMSAASYVVDKEVLDLLRREDVTKSIKALVEADMVRLPYSPMVVEFEVTPKHHEFVFMRETGSAIYGRTCIMSNETQLAMVANEEIKMEVVGGGFVLTNIAKRTEEMEMFIASFMVAINVALLMLNTKGIEKQIVQVPESMNRKRAAHGKPPIPAHSVVHIGTIYRRDGTAIKRDGHGGWHMPMHMRCGHTRTQHFGKGREETKIIYIPPCIVNFKPDEPAPSAPKRKVKV